VIFSATDSFRRETKRNEILAILLQVFLHRPYRTFLRKKTPCKKSADLYPKQGNLFQRINSQEDDTLVQ
jgi:hypothetical protein